ncbi:MAG: cob(I)yrinic acid a,c-diamide adenosyltransferase [Treponema sp.]|nr:cob(I)yrinic acid a,c-diamide adenosyltransferase [Treponema sp.]
MAEKGFIHVYTGNGKGKSTAAFGLALRAAGAGMRVYIGQFMKTGTYYEIRAFRKHLPMISLEQYGSGCLIGKEGPGKADFAAAQSGLEKSRSALTGGMYDMVILDEIIVAAYLDLISEQDILDLIEAKPPGVELVLTGRYAKQSVTERADLVTEMVEVKHYYNQGVLARDGIEK